MANGLPFLAADQAIHQLLDAHTIAQAQSLQVTLGKLRRATNYNAPHTDQLRNHYQGLPDKLRAQGINPQIPWLYGYELDFRFK